MNKNQCYYISGETKKALLKHCMRNIMRLKDYRLIRDELSAQLYGEVCAYYSLGLISTQVFDYLIRKIEAPVA